MVEVVEAKIEEFESAEACFTSDTLVIHMNVNSVAGAG